MLDVKSHKFFDVASQKYESAFCLDGDWEVALVRLKFEHRDEVPAAYVFCDLVEYSYCNGKRMQLLDYWDTQFITNPMPLYVKVTKKRFSSINVNIRSHLRRSENLSSVGATCVLHFRKA